MIISQEVGVYNYCITKVLHADIVLIYFKFLFFRILRCNIILLQVNVCSVLNYLRIGK